MSLATTSSLVCTNNTDANFRAWASDVSAKLASMGQVQTTNPGQIVWVTRTATNDGTINSGSPNFSSATLGFEPRDVGRTIIIPGAGVAAGTLTTTILTYTSSTAVVLSTNASTSVTTSAAHIDAATRPTATNTYQGYEIWRFNDALQSIYPIYYYIRYGTGDGTDRPSMQVLLGTGADDAALLTGPQNTGTVLQVSAGTTSGSTQTCVYSGDTNRVGISMFRTLSSGHCVLFMERPRNAQGVETEGLWVFVANNVNGKGMCYNPSTGIGGVSTFGSGVNCLMGGTTGVSGDDTYLYPCYINKFGQWQGYSFTHLGYHNGDFTAGATASVTVFGTSHTYYFLGTNTNANLIATDLTVGSIAMLYE